MNELRLSVGDFSSGGRGNTTNPCVSGCAHLFLGSLFVMGEGKGGPENGRVESRLAVSAVLANFRSSDISDPQRRLTEALRHAGEVLYMRSQSSTAFRESSATCTALLIRGSRLYAARVGNVQVAVIHHGMVREIFDHMSLGEVSGSNLGLTAEPSIASLTSAVTLADGDRVIIGNASLFSLPEHEILRVGTTLVPAVAARRLIESAERAGANRPTSVQIIQIGDSNLQEGRGIRNLDTPQARGGSPVAPVRHQPTQSKLTNTLVAPRPLRTGVSLDVMPRRQSTARWAIAAALLLAVGGYWYWPHGSNDSFEVPPSLAKTPQITELRENAAPNAPAGNPAEKEDHFWDQVSQHLQSDSGVMDAEQVREWLGRDGEVEQRRKEAQALLEALNEIPVVESGPEYEPSIVSAAALPIDDIPEFEAAPEPKLPPELKSTPPFVKVPEPLVEKRPVVIAPSKRFWNPKRLPTNLRKFENIFAMSSKADAANRLRKYIHARHRRVHKVFDLLGAYLTIAPKARSIRVLEKMKATKPGPQTRKWLRTNLRDLRKALAAEL